MRVEKFAEEFREVEQNVLEKSDKDKRFSATLELCKVAKDGFGILLFFYIYYKNARSNIFKNRFLFYPIFPDRN